MKRLDFIARQAYYIDHLAPIWNAMYPEHRGVFWISPEISEYANSIVKDGKFVAHIDGGECGNGPILACSYGDASRAVEHNENRPVVLMEHGIGLTFGKAAYVDGLGQRVKMSMFPVPNKHSQDKVHPELSSKPHPVVGCPKMDPWAGKFSMKRKMPDKPTIGIAFHHGNQYSRPAETGSAWEHYITYLPELAKKYKLLLHAHPLSSRDLLDVCGSFDIEYCHNFNQILDRADIYLNDCSSTMYEFLVTGKPVILLNAPWFNKKSNWGIRFWEFSDVGPQVDYPEQLPAEIDKLIRFPDIYRPQRSQAVSLLFPYLGSSASRTVSAIEDFLKMSPAPKVIASPPPNIKKIKSTHDKGVLYMCFGYKAREEMERSIYSLRESGFDLPVAIVGDQEGIQSRGSDYGITDTIEWNGSSPFEQDKASMFQFRAGKVKPYFHQITPFKNTLYVDSDTRFISNPEKGFNFLEHWDFVIAQERLAVNQLYNKVRAGWIHSIDERDSTIEEFGGDGNFPFWNSGVFFFNKNKAVEELFNLWTKEWNRWQQWDEQLALMRAANISKARIFVLSEIWNFPHADGAQIILHEYGRGAARSSTQG